ncbi:MAG: hypothetical protein ACXVPQ_08320 [Bacteroidia bacterium]
MRNIILTVLLVTALVSCKKNYTCSCTTTIIYPNNSQDVYQSGTDPYSKKMTEAQAQAACDKQGRDLDKMYLNAFTDNGQYSSGGYSAKTSCSIR